jgi:hypothetical protein
MRTRLRTFLAFLAGSALLTASYQPSSARDGAAMGGARGGRGFSGVGFGHGFGLTHGHGRLGWRGFGHAWRGGGVYLDDRSDNPVIVVNVDRSAAPAQVAPAFFVPSVANLPTLAGIRTPPAAEAAFYVLNEPQAPRSLSRQSAGPRIVQLDPASGGGWKSVLAKSEPERSEPEHAFGARIIHLSVPVGGRD